ncbi:MAG TPA: SDR family NAD(P)-dependent oxidoreductase, partial [Rhodothermales bacterium]|nr:SDR family NAD(P)-dependent oxidoreductase [Rhodothermales bacterium]
MRVSRSLSGLTATLAAYAAYRVGTHFSRHFHLHGATVLILGGSRGLGFELARAYADAGASRLLLVARDHGRLLQAKARVEAHGAMVDVRAFDLRTPGAAAEAVAWAKEQYGRLDVLVCNAGIIQAAPREHVTDKDYDDAFALHVQAPREAIEAAVPLMRDQPQRGRIVVISSVGGIVPVPHLIPYSASKFALTGLGGALTPALRREGIYLTTVCPGLMRTGGHRNAAFKGQAAKEFAWFAISDASPLLSMSAARAARRIVAASRTGQARLTLTLNARLAHALDT